MVAPLFGNASAANAFAGGRSRHFLPPASRPSPLHFIACYVLANWEAVARRDGLWGEPGYTGAHRFIPILLLTAIGLERDSVYLGVAMKFASYLLHGGTAFAQSPTLARVIKQSLDLGWIAVDQDRATYYVTPFGRENVLSERRQGTLWLVSPHDLAGGTHSEGFSVADPHTRKLIEGASQRWFLAPEAKLRQQLTSEAFRLAMSPMVNPSLDLDPIYLDAANEASTL